MKQCNKLKSFVISCNMTDKFQLNKKCKLNNLFFE